MKEYKFISNGVTPKESEHIFEYEFGCTLQFYLMWRLIHVYDISLNKELFNEYCNELAKFIEEEYQLNQKGEKIITHYSSISIEAELLTEFLELKFKK